METEVRFTLDLILKWFYELKIRDYISSR